MDKTSSYADTTINRSSKSAQAPTAADAVVTKKDVSSAAVTSSPEGTALRRTAPPRLHDVRINPAIPSPRPTRARSCLLGGLFSPTNIA